MNTIELRAVNAALAALSAPTSLATEASALEQCNTVGGKGNEKEKGMGHELLPLLGFFRASQWRRKFVGDQS